MIEKLETLVKAGRIPHALVIDGGTYEGRLNCAKELASAIVGETNKVLNDIHPDVITILPEEKKKTLSIEIIRKMRDDAFILPNESEKKVYIVAKAELMQAGAQNALLKILEEPPTYATFILLCDTHSVLLGTILSRVALFNIGESERDDSDDTYNECNALAKELAAKTAARDQFGLLKVVASFEKDFDMLSLTLDILQSIIRDALVINAGGNTLISGAEKEANALATKLTSEELLSRQSGIADIVKSINIYANKNLTLARLVAKLIGGPND